MEARQEDYPPGKPDKRRGKKPPLTVVGPTQAEIDAANRGDYAPRGLTKLLVNLSKSWLMRLGLIGGGAAITYIKVPTVHQFVNSIPEYWQNYHHSSEVVKVTVDPTTAVYMTAEEYEKDGPPAIKHDDVNILTPVQLPKEKANASIEYTLKQGSFKRLINSRPDPEKPGEQITDGEVDVNDTATFSNIPKGSTLVSPIEGVITFFHHPLWAEKPNGVLSNTGFFIEGKDEAGNEVSIAVSTAELKTIINSPRIVTNEKGEVVPPPPIPVKAGQPIGIIWSEENHPFFPGQIQISATSIVRENGEKRGGPSNIKIAVTPQGQIIMLR